MSFKRFMFVLGMISLLLVCSAQAGDEGVNSKFKVKFYGFVKFEAIMDNTEIAKGDWQLYARPGDSDYADRSTFTMNARHTRLGFKFAGPDVNDLKVTGLIEVDFAGGFPNSGTAARQPNLRLRHAWVQIAAEKWEARFGQDWALISGPFPNTTNFVVGAGKGNLWMRYPQMRFTYKADPMKISISLNRPMAGNIKYEDFTGGDFDPVGDGERSGMPWVMGRIWLNAGQATFSVSGHYGTESDEDPNGELQDVESYSMNGDLVFKTGPVAFTVRGFMGANLNSFFGGCFQNVYYDPVEEEPVAIAAMGGWGQLKYALNEKWEVTVGGGFDDPDEEDLRDSDPANAYYSIDKNDWMFGNIAFKLDKSVVFQLGADYLATTYMDDAAGNEIEKGENIRTMFVTYYKF